MNYFINLIFTEHTYSVGVEEKVGYYIFNNIYV